MRGELVATVDIQPPNDIFATFGRLNYKPWYALAEFVDNATQNFFTHMDRIADADGEALLDIDIDYDGQAKVLTISDNAHGMDLDELTRAMKISAPPPDKSGRSEFGMGMKTAACWFGSRWSVDTTQLGSDRAYRVVFDVEALAASGAHSLEVDERPAERTEHGTTLRIEGLRKPIVGRQIEKIRKTLTSMYRQDIKSGRVQLTWRGELLEYEAPELWMHERPDGSLHEMRQEIDLVVTDPATGLEHQVRGWVGVLKTMSSSENGFALFRRNRLILGLPGEGWRPSELMGATGIPSWKRLVGELHMDDFPVNFTKDGFAWEGGLEDALIEALAPLVSAYKSFASDLRTRGRGGGVTAQDFVRAVDEVQEGVRMPTLGRDLVTLGTPLPPGQQRMLPEPAMDERADPVPSVLEVPLPTGTLRATLYVKDEGPAASWLSVQSVANDDLDVIINTAHPFVAACCEDERGTILIGKFVLALALAEQQARVMHGETIPADEIRTYLNTFLVHSKP